MLKKQPSCQGVYRSILILILIVRSLEIKKVDGISRYLVLLKNISGGRYLVYNYEQQLQTVL